MHEALKEAPRKRSPHLVSYLSWASESFHLQSLQWLFSLWPLCTETGGSLLLFPLNLPNQPSIPASPSSPSHPHGPAGQVTTNTQPLCCATLPLYHLLSGENQAMAFGPFLFIASSAPNVMPEDWIAVVKMLMAFITFHLVSPLYKWDNVSDLLRT